MIKKYLEIIDLPHHQSSDRAHMSMYDRAAQFAPFAALTGYGEAVNETARLTDDYIELDSMYLDEMNEKIKAVMNRIDERPRIRISYFQPDRMKSGGEYLVIDGRIKKIDEFSKTIIFEDNVKIPMDMVFDIEELKNADE